MCPIEPTLLFDPQQTLDMKPCPTCGGETYGPGYLCPCCREAGL